MAPQSVFITGCNRGIGLELVKQFLALPNPPRNIFATYRSKERSGELLELAGKTSCLHPLQLEVTNTGSYPDIVNQVDAVVGDAGLNLLINNSGVLPQNRDLHSVTPEDMMEAYMTNCVAPQFLARAFLPLLHKAAALKAGPSLCVDKAAIVQSLSVDLADTGVLVMAMHPGWVLTEMGGPNAQISTETCCSTMIQTLEGLTEKDHGAFLRYNNTPIQW